MPGVLLEPLMEYSERRTGGPSYYQRTLGTAIGRELRSYYDLSEPIPDRMLKLLKQLDEHDVKPDRSRILYGDTPYHESDPKKADGERCPASVTCEQDVWKEHHHALF
jgi:hypothetical protein